MRTGRPKTELRLSPQEHAQLSSLAASRSLPRAAGGWKFAPRNE